MSASCPCHSKRPYGDCCRPYHRGELEAPSAEALMRSRFSAFALGLGAYLVRTLSAPHPDRADPNLERSLSQAKTTHRYMGLSIVHTSQEQVLFLARIFVKGRDQSFAELSTFADERDHNAGPSVWRYASGIMLPGERLPQEGLTLDTFLDLTANR
jgi:SEC-C motif domain protein